MGGWVVGDFLRVASAVLSRSEQRAECISQNISNIVSAGYKKKTSFFASINPVTPNPSSERQVGTDFSQGKPIETGNFFDLMLEGAGFFVVRGEGRELYTRLGAFKRSSDGRVLDSGGRALQLESGGDLIVKSSDLEVLSNGLVLDRGEPVGRLARVKMTNQGALVPVGLGIFRDEGTGGRETSEVPVRQGALEASNVNMADEMVAMMEAVRRAEAGQKLVGVYDDLMGRVLTSLGQA